MSRRRAVPKGRDRTKSSPTARKLQYSEEQTSLKEAVEVDSPTMSPPVAVTFSSPTVPKMDKVFTTPINAPSRATNTQIRHQRIDLADKKVAS